MYILCVVWYLLFICLIFQNMRIFIVLEKSKITQILFDFLGIENQNQINLNNIKTIQLTKVLK